MSGVPYTPAEDALLIACYQAELTHAQLSAELGRSKNSLRSRLRILADWGRVHLRPRYRRPEPPLPVGLTADDLAWMHYWRQPRAVRRQPRCATLTPEESTHG